MNDINLLPEDLRGRDKQTKKVVREEIHYSDPRKEANLSGEVRLKKSKLGFWKNFFQKRKQKRQQKKQLVEEEKRQLKDHHKFQSEAPKAIKTDLPQTSVIRPKFQTIVKNEQVKPPVKLGFWQKLVSRRKIRPARVSPSSANVSRPASLVARHPEVSENSSPKMHLPKNNHSDKGLEVDLAADKTLLFSLDEFYYRLKVGLISLLVVFIILGVLYIVVVKFQVLFQNGEQSLSSEIEQLEAELNQFEKEKEEIVVLDRQLKRIDQLLRQHLFWTKLFSLLEVNTINDVYYNALNVDASGKIILSSVAKDYASLARQIAVWQNQEEVRGVEFSQAALKEQKLYAGGEEELVTTLVNFELILDLDPKFLTNEDYGQE